VGIGKSSIEGRKERNFAYFHAESFRGCAAEPRPLILESNGAGASRDFDRGSVVTLTAELSIDRNPVARGSAAVLAQLVVLVLIGLPMGAVPG
jgi:hypothetical protein